MTPRQVGPVVVRRRLGSELRRLREDRNKRLEEVAAELEISASKLSRLENGRGIPRTWEVRNLLTLYRVDDERLRNRLIGWANDGKATGWWQQYSDEVVADLDYYLSLEAESAAIDAYCTPVLQGLVQTEAYARAVLSKLLPLCDEAAITELVRIRLGRQEIITRSDGPVRLRLVVDEAVLHRVTESPEVMRAQLNALLAHAHRPHVELRIFPFSAGVHQASSAFTIFTPRIATIDPVVVNIESTEHDAYEEKPEGVQVFRAIFDDLLHRSLDVTASTKLISELIG